ncbi:DUF998 domain-containing protein [Halorubrum sp. Hd13]|uniref:DUF998 domain-containing protein n=1 Tax=Halorubrum sp. Hd13 TaxID=1480728 RepID=UPI000B9945D7|nr:DUF998 domain-containing protein [Halorubrum sp. Hd13]OYR48016.1 hypothetical protein DJ81_00080 [Halorubrum sp. Hd13]
MITRNSAGKWGGLVGVVGMVIWWVVATVLGLMWPSYNAVTNVISALAGVGAPYAGVQQLNFYIFGASIIIFAIGLLAWSDRGWRLLVGVPLLVVFGTGVIVAGFFQYDPNNLEAATTQYHNTASLVTFLAAIPAISITSWGLNHDARWPNYRNKFVPLGIAILTIGGLAIFLVSTGSGPSGWMGLGQRIFLLLLTGWLAYHAFLLYRLSDRSDASA